MNETLARYWARIKQYWNGFSRTNKITIIASVLIMILTIGIIAYNLSKTEYALAYTNLQPGDAAAIKSYLDTAKIPYQLSSDGKSIGVPRNMVASVKLDVESQGLNKNGNVGYGAFDSKSSMTTSDKEFNVKYINAVQGELQQLINQNQAISSSKVLISLPEPDRFLSANQDKASASVVLNIKPGYVLDQAKIDTFYNLVSHSVKNLPTENITISDQNGDMLNFSKGPNATGSASGSLQNTPAQMFSINNQYRNDVLKTVQTMLGNILGKDKVIVSVFSTMNFDEQKTSRKMVTAPNQIDQKGLEISLQEIQKNYTSDGGAAAGGTAGTGGTDVPGYPGATGSGKSNSEEVSRTVNYEVNHINDDITYSPFVVKDLTINVGIEPPNKNDPNSLSPQTINEVNKLLVNIVRASLADSRVTYTEAQLAQKVSVMATPFAGNTAAASSNNNWNWLLYGGLGALATALLAGGGFFWMRRKQKREEEEQLASAPPKVEYPTIDLETVSNDNQVRKQLESLAKKKPEEFVNLLRTWLVDE